MGQFLMPGPIVAATEIFLMYTPLAPDGRAFLMASINAAKFSNSFTASNEDLPMAT